MIIWFLKALVTDLKSLILLIRIVKRLFSSHIPATTKEVATNESIAAEYCGSLSDKNFDVSRQSNVATPSTMHPWSTGIWISKIEW